MLAALAALIALSAYFSATETAFTSLNRIRLKTRADDGDKRAARTLALAADYDRLLSTLLIGNNIVNNVATTIGAVLFIKLIGSAKGPTVSATVLTVVILVFGEVTPKSLAKERPEAWAIAATPLLRVLAVVAPMFSRLGVGSDAVMPARPREHCVLLLRPWAATGWVTLGALPLKPRQEPEVPAPPTSTQSHAAVPARPRFARTLRASLRGRGPLRAGLR